MIDFVEVKSSRANLDELFNHLLLWYVGDHNMLGVGWQDCKSIRDSTRFFLLLFLKSSFKIFKSFSIIEFLMANNFAH